LCEALDITGAHDGLALDRPPFALAARSEDVEVATPSFRSFSASRSSSAWARRTISCWR